MNSRNAVVPGVFATLLLAVSAAGQINAIPTSTTNLPPIGLAATETVQVNVVNTSAEPPARTSTSCGGSIAFYNAAGTIIGTATPFTVTPGQIFSAKLASTGGARAVVRAQIMAPIFLSSPESILGGLSPVLPVLVIPACTMTYSLETYDSTTGVTHLFFSGPVIQAVLGLPVAR